MKVEKIGELSVISSKRGHRSEIVCLVIDAMNEVKFWLTLVAQRYFCLLVQSKQTHSTQNKILLFIYIRWEVGDFNSKFKSKESAILGSMERCGGHVRDQLSKMLRLALRHVIRN
jgi:hypothetical protein